jgi:ankyrin repeat protein
MGWRCVIALVVIMSDLDIGNLLINKGEDIKARNRSGWTPLLKGVVGDEARESQHDVLMELMERGADVEVRDVEGLRPEDIAEKKGWELVRDQDGTVRYVKRKWR